MKVKTETVNGKRIEIHRDPRECVGPKRYWALVDGSALFQRGRTRLRTFTTVDAAWQAALKTAR